MSQVSISLDGVFITILTAPSFNNFTVLELRSAFMALSNGELDKNKAQRVVYREVLKLQKKGLLKRTDSKSTKKTSYSKTDLFHTAKLISKDGAFNSASKGSVDEINRAAVKDLTERLYRIKGELQTLIAESNGYKALYAEYPKLKGIQQNYNRSRDNIRSLDGLVKSLEKTIKDQNILEINDETS